MTLFINCIFIGSAILNFYYLYNLSNILRMKYFHNTYENTKLSTPQIIREGNSSSNINDNFHEMHMQIRQPQPHLMQMNYDNNTASIYKYVTNLHVVGPF